MAHEHTIAVMQGTALLSLLEPDALRILAFSSDIRTLRSGEVLFRRGERSDGAYVVLRGGIAIGRSNAPDDASNVMRPGALLGRTALFIRSQRPATAVAIEASEVMRISPTLMRRVLEEFPDGAARLQAALQAELSEFSQSLAAVAAQLDAMEEGGLRPAG